MPKEKDKGADTTENSKQTKARSFKLEITKKKCGAEEQGGDGNNPSADALKTGGLNSYDGCAWEYGLLN